ncbi:protein phosphatase [Synechococcus sp. CCY9202]|uniref:protein phosphatase n=1 Tax=Synechococcus sp. CCY9202 TaxID=174698 RepID=UPI002B1FE5C8|nr:protein phosphatase [Synechococcus sp. CCY9202]MEA5423682.1 protein phosphatase [Synechococcus sp. CCY9202]
MASDSQASAAALQATLFDFAIAELVRQHRQSFAPLWTRDSWAKLLIWLALNCGAGHDRDDLEAFAAALGPVLTRRMRRLFFERELEDLGLQVMADPAEQQVLVLPLAGEGPVDRQAAAAALEQLGLSERVVEPERWQALEAVLAVPWAQNGNGHGDAPGSAGGTDGTDGTDGTAGEGPCA